MAPLPDLAAFPVPTAKCLKLLRCRAASNLAWFLPRCGMAPPQWHQCQTDTAEPVRYNLYLFNLIYIYIYIYRFIFIFINRIPIHCYLLLVIYIYISSSGFFWAELLVDLIYRYNLYILNSDPLDPPSFSRGSIPLASLENCKIPTCTYYQLLS